MTVNDELWARYCPNGDLWITGVDPTRWINTGKLLKAPGPLDWGTASPDAIRCVKSIAHRIIDVESVPGEPGLVEIEVSFWNATCTQLETGACFQIGGTK